MSKISKIAAVFPSKTTAADEKALAKCFDEMLATQKDIDTLLAEVEKLKPLADVTMVDLKKRQTIAKSRAAETKDMAKDRAKGTLHSNPGKMARVYKDLNEDVAQANWLEGGVDKALNEEFAKEVVKLTQKIVAGLPKGVSTGHLALGVKMTHFVAKNTKEKWAKYDANVDALEKTVAKEAANVQREQGIKALMSDAAYAKLRYNTKQKAVDAGVASDTATADTVTAALDVLLERQRKPSKGAWASFLDLGAGGSYKLTSGGSYDGMVIHLTMSKDSWTANADGKVSVATNSVDQIYEKLLKVDGWKQLHATLEVSKKAADYPHVFLIDGVLGNDTKWEAARVLLGKDASWVTDGQAALAVALAKVTTAIKAKIKLAKAEEGANVA